VAIRDPTLSGVPIRLCRDVAFAPAAVQLVAKASATRIRVIPWEEYGDTSMGRLIAGRGPSAGPRTSRVKLMDYHQDPPWLSATPPSPGHRVQGLAMTFHVPEPPR
jgi:hypothetical protein